MFEIDSFESRIELRLRNRFLVGGGRKSRRARMLRRALQDSAVNFGRSPRIVGAGASAAKIFSRAGLAALCGMWTGDLKQSGVYIRHNWAFR